MLKEKESDILRTVMDGLAAKRIWHVRMNSGGMFGKHNGKSWAVKFGRKGMADVLALRATQVMISHAAYTDSAILHIPIWIECKTATGKQTPDQAEFQREVEAEGHRYILCRSWEELCAKL